MAGIITAIPRRQNYGRPQSVPHDNLIAGLVTSYDQSKVPDNALTAAVNVDPVPTGELVSRPGIKNSDVNNAALPNPYGFGGTLSYIFLGVFPDYGNSYVEVGVFAYTNGTNTGFFQCLMTDYTTVVSLNNVVGNYLDSVQMIMYGTKCYFYIDLTHNFFVAIAGGAVTTFNGPATGTWTPYSRFYLFRDRVYYYSTSGINYSKKGSPDVWSGDPDAGSAIIGDSSNVKAISGVRDVLYIFKETSLWAMYGDPVLNNTYKLINGNVGSDLSDVGQYRDIIYFQHQGYIYELVNGTAKNISYQLTPFSLAYNHACTSVFSFYKERLIYKDFVYNLQTRTWTRWSFTSSVGNGAFQGTYFIINTMSACYYFEQEFGGFIGPKNVWKFVDGVGYDDINSVKNYIVCDFTTKTFVPPDMIGINRLYALEIQTAGQFTTLVYTVKGTGSGLTDVNPAWPTTVGNAPVTVTGTINQNDAGNALLGTFPFVSTKVKASLRSRGFKYQFTTTCSNGQFKFLGFVEVIRPKVGINSEVSSP